MRKGVVVRAIEVNATSVGMGTLADLSLVDSDKVGDFPVVMDIVYAPLETKLLREARRAGCTTIDGLQIVDDAFTFNDIVDR